VFWADFNHRLLQFFPGEERYAGEIEKEIFNVILAAQDSNGAIRYHNRVQGNKDRPNSINTCCEVMGVPFIARLPQYLYSLAADGLYVNLFAPSTITWGQDGRPVTVRAVTDFPLSGKVVLRIATAAPQALKLRIRVPNWATGDVACSVNGRAAAPGKPGSYVTIDRTWNDGDAVAFELALAFRTIRYTGLDQHPEHERHALLYGPVLMALLGADDLDLPAGELPSRLRPIDGTPLHFAIEGRAGVQYQPYWQVDQETFTCFPTMR
jgi:DUF1680 family protein